VVIYPAPLVIALLLRDMFADPSKDTPAIVRAVANFVAVAALPVVDPDVPETLPVTFPVKAPTNVVAVTIPVTDAAAPTILVNSTDGEPVRPAEVPEVF